MVLMELEAVEWPVEMPVHPTSERRGGRGA